MLWRVDTYCRSSQHKPSLGDRDGVPYHDDFDNALASFIPSLFQKNLAGSSLFHRLNRLSGNLHNAGYRCVPSSSAPLDGLPARTHDSLQIACPGRNNGHDHHVAYPHDPVDSLAKVTKVFSSSSACRHHRKHDSAVSFSTAPIDSKSLGCPLEQESEPMEGIPTEGTDRIGSIGAYEQEPAAE